MTTMTSRSVKLASAILITLGLCLTADMTQARGIEGAWELVSYELSGRNVPVSGVLVFTEGEFGMIYSMGPGERAEFGRAHAGTYELEDNRVKFDVKMWVQKTEASTGVVPGKVVEAELEWRDGGLILHFEGGSVQELHPIKVENELASGSWKPETTSRHAVLVASDGRYVLLCLDETTLEGTAYGGAVVTDGTGRANWAISVDGESGTVAVGTGQPILEFSNIDGSVEFHDAEGNVLNFAKQ